MRRQKKVLKWLYRNQRIFIVAGGIAIAIWALIDGDWFTRTLILMTIFFFLLARIF